MRIYLSVDFRRLATTDRPFSVNDDEWYAVDTLASCIGHHRLNLLQELV